MTVQELMAQLAQFHPDMPVCLEDWSEKMCGPCVLRSVEKWYGDYAIDTKRGATGDIIILGCSERDR